MADPESDETRTIIWEHRNYSVIPGGQCGLDTSLSRLRARACMHRADARACGERMGVPAGQQSLTA